MNAISLKLVKKFSLVGTSKCREEEEALGLVTVERIVSEAGHKKRNLI